MVDHVNTSFYRCFTLTFGCIFFPLKMHKMIETSQIWCVELIVCSTHHILLVKTWGQFQRFLPDFGWTFHQIPNFRQQKHELWCWQPAFSDQLLEIWHKSPGLDHHFILKSYQVTPKAQAIAVGGRAPESCGHHGHGGALGGSRWTVARGTQGLGHRGLGHYTKKEQQEKLWKTGQFFWNWFFCCLARG